MEQIKRQTSSSFDNYSDNKRQKTQITTTNETHCLPKKTISHFEDLSNELVYEIFDFLDYFHVYEAFSPLNLRFHNLLTKSNLPIKINFSSIPKSTFECYNKDIIETSIDRISSLYFSEVFSYDLILSSISKLSKFTRLETLVLHNIEWECLENLVHQLSTLSLLSSLVITIVDIVRSYDTILQILRLPALIYCKLPFGRWGNGRLLPVANNEYSPIEHLIITTYVYLDEITSSLSYFPNLRRLTLQSLSVAWGSQPDVSLSPCILIHLTHVSLNAISVKFDQFRQLVISAFRSVQVLHLRSDHYSYSEYIDAKSWQQLIVSHMPNLRIFDIQLHIQTSDQDDQLTIETEISQFTSPFWIERQWFFAHYFYQTGTWNYTTFYSTNPYRRKHYTLPRQLDTNTTLNHDECNINSIQHVHIPSKECLINCTKYFPNATELIFEDGFSMARSSTISLLNRIISLKRLTKLVIKCDRFSVQAVTKILYYSPNIHTLELQSILCYQKSTDYTSIIQSEDFQLVSSTNNITDVMCKTECAFEKVKLLVALCPRMKHLTIDTPTKDLESITRFLLDKTNQNTSHLCSLCFSSRWKNWPRRINSFISSNTLAVDYTLKGVERKLYLWR